MDNTNLLTFRALRVVNVERCKVWHPGFGTGTGDWNGADWSNAMQGEAGEAGNFVKKLRRQDTGFRGAADPDRSVLLEKLGDEIADTAIYLDLLAEYYGINMAEAVVRKFNAISVREGLPQRLPENLA